MFWAAEPSLIPQTSVGLLLGVSRLCWLVSPVSSIYCTYHNGTFSLFISLHLTGSSLRAGTEYSGSSSLSVPFLWSRYKDSLGRGIKKVMLCAEELKQAMQAQRRKGASQGKALLWEEKWHPFLRKDQPWAKGMIWWMENGLDFSLHSLYSWVSLWSTRTPELYRMSLGIFLYSLCSD